MTEAATVGGSTRRYLTSVDWCNMTRPSGPVLVTDRVAPCRVTTDDVMRALRCAGQASRSGKTTNFGLWLDGRAAQWDYPLWLPRDEDLSLDIYVERVLRESSAASFCYSQFNLQYYDRVIWDWASHFAQSYADRVGLPDGEVDVDVFLGCYPSTPRGIHRDSADTFMFVLSGRKRLLFWPAEQLECDGRRVGHPGLESLPSVSTDNYRDTAIALEGGPGEIFYWPADYWHVGDAPDASLPSLALNIGFHKKPQRTARDAMVEILLSVMPELQASDTIGDRDRNTYVRRSDLATVNLIAEGALTGPMRDMLKWWGMQTQSAAGFHTVPPLRDDLIAGRTVRAWVPTRPGAVLWSLDDSGKRLDVAANGHILSVPATPEIQAWLASLIGEMQCDPAQSPYVEEVMRFLLAADAIAPCDK